MSKYKYSDILLRDYGAICLTNIMLAKELLNNVANSHAL